MALNLRPSARRRTAAAPRRSWGASRGSQRVGPKDSLASAHMLFMPGRRSLVVVIVALASLVAPTAASTAGQIVIYGAASGSHLELTTSGGRLVVNGWMAKQSPQGCHFVSGRDRAVCSLSGADRVELQMGRSEEHTSELQSRQYLVC